MKKLLALILSIALCFTVFAGCFATSAAAPDFSVSANGNVVTVSGTIAENSQYAVMLKITLDDDLTLASIVDGNGTPLEAYAEDKETWHYVLDNTGKIISALELYNDTFTYVITVNAPANDSCEAPSDPYAVSVVADYADYNADAPTLEQYTGSADVIVPAKDHTPADAVKENEVAAEVGKEGSYDNVVYCSACNTELSRENVKVPALEPEEPECEHANAEWKLTNVTETHFEYDAATCPDCDAVDVEKDVEIGEPNANQLQLSFTIDPKDSVALIFRTYITNVEGYENLTVVAKKPIYDGTDTISSYYIEKYTIYKSDRYSFVFDQLSAYEFGTEVTAYLYGLNSNNQMVLIGSRTAAVSTYAANYINRSGVTEDLNKALADMMLYGDAAQLYQGYNTENLCSNALTAEQKAKATQTYPDANTSFTKVDTSTVTGDTTTAAGTVQLTRGLSPKAKVNININLKAYGSETDLYDYYCSFSYYDAYGVAVDEQYTVQYAGDLYSGRPSFVFDKCPISTLDYPVHADVYYGDPANGGVLVASTNFSIETYIANYVSSNDVATANLMKTMYAYGHSLAVYAETPAYVA